MSTERRQYKNLQIQGHVEVQSVDIHDPWQTVTEERYVVLLVGSTGAGKSNFLEVLSGGTLSGISRNQLKGVTQSVQLYRLLNCQRCHKTVYLVDTPGLCDNDLSEMRVFRMISAWMNEAHVSGFDCLLYFDSMTATRMSASRLSGIVMVQKALLRHVSGQTVPDFHPTLVHVTTMWNSILDTQLERPLRQFEELRSSSGPWKDFATPQNPTPAFARFRNTQRSAMKILDGIGLYPYHAGTDTSTTTSNTMRFFPISLPVVMNVFRPKPNTPFGELAQVNLLSRIADVKQQLAKASEDLESAEEAQDLPVVEALRSQREELIMKLANFERDEDEFTSTSPQRPHRRRSSSQSGGQTVQTSAPRTRFVIPSSTSTSPVTQRLEFTRSEIRLRVSPAGIAEPLPSPVRFHLPESADSEPNTPSSRPPSSYTTNTYRQSDSIDPSPIEVFHSTIGTLRQNLERVAPSALIIHATRSHRSSMHTPSDSSVEISFRLSPSSRLSSQTLGFKCEQSTIIHRDQRASLLQSLPPTPTHSASATLLTTPPKRRPFDEWPQNPHPNTHKSWKNKVFGRVLRFITPKSSN